MCNLTVLFNVTNSNRCDYRCKILANNKTLNKKKKKKNIKLDTAAN